MKQPSNFVIGFIILILSIVLYGNTLSHEYALDDAIVITSNQFTQQGLSGIPDIFANESFTGFFGKDKKLVSGGRYRPLSIATFAVEYEYFGKAPGFSHFINIILYALTAFVLFLCLSLLFKNNSGYWFLSVSFVATLLFLLHPIHTEVVANIKGRDEILTLLGSLVSFWMLFKAYDNEPKKRNLLLPILSAIVFLLALLSKENAVTFVAIVPLCLILFRNATIKNAIIITTPLLVATIIFLYIRHRVLGSIGASEEITELLNNPFTNASTADKFATIFYTLLLYIKLLLFPHPLTFDYYPFHIAIQSFSNFAVVVSVIIYCALIAAGIWGFAKKKLWTVAIIFFLIPLSIVSNIVFPIGTFMNERFIFISSIGFAVIIGFVIAKFAEHKHSRILSGSLLLIVFGLYTTKTIARNKAWKNDLTLFTTDVKTSVNSAKSTCSAGGKLLEAAKENINKIEQQEQLKQSLYYLQRSVHIYPQYTEANLLLGNCHFEFANYDSTLFYYRKVLERAPMHERALENIQIVLNKIENVDNRIKYLLDFYSLNAVNYDINYKLGQTFGKEKGDINRAIFYLERAIKIDPTKKEAFKDLGVAYGMSNRLADALLVLEKAKQLAPDDFQIYLNIGITLSNQGKTTEAQSYFTKAQQLQATTKQ